MPQINHSALANFFQDDTEMLCDLANMFAKSMDDCAARLNYAVERRDGPALREMAHQLQCRLGYFSAVRLRELALSLELKGKENQLNDVQPIVERLFSGIDEMMNELRELTGMPLRFGDDE